MSEKANVELMWGPWSHDEPGHKVTSAQPYRLPQANKKGWPMVKMGQRHQTVATRQVEQSFLQMAFVCRRRARLEV